VSVTTQMTHIQCTATTCLCGARSGSPQLNRLHFLNVTSKLLNLKSRILTLNISIMGCRGLLPIHLVMVKISCSI